MRQQMIRQTTTGAAGIVLVLLAVVLVNWISVRQLYWRYDCTSDKIYSLSEKSKAILAGLDEEIEVVVFMTKVGSPMYREVSELLNRYQAASDKISVEYIDPDRQPLRTRQLAEQFKISLADTVVFTCGERSKYVTANQMAELDYSGAQYGEPPRMRAFKGEEQFTSAILSLAAARVPKVYFVTGHGETSIAGSPTERSISLLQEELKRENMEVAVAGLLTGTIPEDADILAIIGPTQPFTDGEIELLAGFLDRGGRLLVCLDPLIDDNGSVRDTRLEGLLDRYGAHVNSDLLVDPSAGLQGWGPSAIYLDTYQQHPITTGLEGVASLFLVARSIEPNPGEGWTATTLVETSDQGWGETSLKPLLAGGDPIKDESDNKGPAAVAVAVDAGQQTATDGTDPGDTTAGEHPAGFRMVVFGDADLVNDDVFLNLGNKTLALNAFNWLAEREEIVGIPPRIIDQPSSYLSSQALLFILIVTVLLMPGAAVVLGIMVWRRRRH